MYNRCVKIDLKIPISLGKISENRTGGFFFDSHCTHYKRFVTSVISTKQTAMRQRESIK